MPAKRGTVEGSKFRMGDGFLSFLEMYGIVGCEICTASELPQLLDRAPRTVVFVSHHDEWEPVTSQLDYLLEKASCVVIEGPVSDSLAARFNLGTKVSSDELGICRAADPVLREHLSKLLEGYVDASTIDLRPIQVTAKTAVGSAVADSSPPFHNPLPVEQVFFGARAPLLTLISNEDAALLVRSGKVIISSHPFFALAAQRLGIRRMRTPISAMSGARNGEALDYLLLHAVADACRRFGRPLVTVEPWPSGVSNVVSIRHDVDRPVSPEDWRRLRSWQKKHSLRASWYFLAKTIDRERMKELFEDGHEIAFHYTNLERNGERELSALEAALPEGCRIVGAACHGGNFFGQSDLDWLSKKGFSYAEILTRCSFFPFRPPYEVAGSQCVERLDLIVAARHVSVDASLSPPRANFMYGDRTRAARLRCRAHVIVMNHPDINFDAMASAVLSHIGTSSENWTQAEAVTWWRQTHTDSARLEVRGEDDGAWTGVDLVHAASRTPALRIWAPIALCDGTAVDDMGERHTIVPSGSSVLENWIS